MKLVAAKCPSCGADIEVDKNSDRTKCEYCKSKIIVEDAIAKYKLEVTGRIEIKNIPKLENYLKLGKRHYEDGEYQEAYNAYSKAVEIDPDNSEAILRKGISKSLCTNYLNFEIESAYNGTKNALNLIDNQELKDSYIMELFAAISKLEQFAINFYNSNYMSLDDVMTFINRLFLCLNILEYSFVTTENKDNKITIVNKIIELIHYIFKTKRYSKGSYNITFKQRKNLIIKKNYYYEQLRLLKPVISTKEKKKNKNDYKFKKNLIFPIIIEFIIFCFSMVVFNQGKSPIWGVLLLVDFIIILPKVSNKIFKNKKIGLWVKILVFIVAMIGYANNSYPSWAFETYSSDTTDMILKFNRDVVTMDEEKTNYQWEIIGNETIIIIEEYKFKYKSANNQYLFCLLENDECKHYFYSDNSSQEYIKFNN